MWDVSHQYLPYCENFLAMLLISSSNEAKNKLFLSCCKERVYLRKWKSKKKRGLEVSPSNAINYH